MNELLTVGNEVSAEKHKASSRVVALEPVLTTVCTEHNLLQKSRVMKILKETPVTNRALVETLIMNRLAS